MRNLIEFPPSIQLAKWPHLTGFVVIVIVLVIVLFDYDYEHDYD